MQLGSEMAIYHTAQPQVIQKVTSWRPPCGKKVHEEYHHHHHVLPTNDHQSIDVAQAIVPGTVPDASAIITAKRLVSGTRYSQFSP